MKSNPEIDPFKKGYLEAMGTHNEIIAQFREMTSDKSLNDAVVNVMKKYRYTFSRNIETIEKHYSDFVTSYNPDAVNKKNKQDFYLFFPNEEFNQNRLDFLLLKEIFLRMREFNSRFRKEWDELLKGIGVINLVADGKSTYTVCANTINEALSFCEKTDQFLHFIAAVLSIPENDFDVMERDIANKIIYFESFSYSYRGVFSAADAADRANADKEILDLYDRKKDPKAAPKQAERKIPEKKESSSEDITHQFMRADVAYNARFTVRGTCTWNRTEPYIIKIDQAKLLKDYSDLEYSVYFNDEVPDPVKVNGMVKRAIFKYLRDTSAHIKEPYGEFILKTVSHLTSEISGYLDIPFDRTALFIYHLGPLTVSRAVIDIFQETNLGVCYKLLDDTKVSKFIPQEFIREKTLDWYEDNINNQDIPCDRVSDFAEFKRIATEKYNAERIKSMQKIDHAVEQYYAKTGKQIDKGVFLKSKVKELFGVRNIAVFNRFIDKTIFK
ncbi:MAG: hypothetical protein ACRCUT_00105 [Spirochaetota bacterium]